MFIWIVGTENTVYTTNLILWDQPHVHLDCRWVCMDKIGDMIHKGLWGNSIQESKGEVYILLLQRLDTDG